MTEEKARNIEQVRETLFKASVKYEIELAINSLRILERHAVVIFDIALSLWKSSKLNVEISNLIDFFMRDPKGNYKRFTSNQDMFVASLGGYYE